VGEARRRGTREERIAKVKERKLAERQALIERAKADEQARSELLASMPPEERKAVVLASGRRSTLALAALLASSGVYLGGPGWRK
jgi:rhodanese-related sulfurtransferase